MRERSSNEGGGGIARERWAAPKGDGMEGNSGNGGGGNGGSVARERWASL